MIPNVLINAPLGVGYFDNRHLEVRFLISNSNTRQMSDIPLTRAMRGVYPNLHAPKGTKRIQETNQTVWKSRKRFFGRERKDAGGHKKSLNGSGFNE